jgi:hypothetical protein
MINSLRGSIQMHLIGRRGELLRISCENRDPMTAQKIVETISKLFVNENIELLEKETLAGIDFLRDRLREYLFHVRSTRYSLIFSGSVLPHPGHTNGAGLMFSIYLSVLISSRMAPSSSRYANAVSVSPLADST